MKKIVVIFALLAIFVIGCSQKSDKDYLETAKTELAAKEYAAALINFQKIVDEFPESEHYKFALLQTGELNHGLVNKEISKEVAFEKAIKAYTEYQKKYTDDPKAPQALFLVGFIQANELGNIEAAKVAYTKFLKLYPESEMAESAHSEIDNLGLAPDEILLKNMAK
ncbi:MAG: tetratricopeptide repeat protein [Bacteroidetes bacterium]|nr:tetratricopeptide repeat protein [Bacteroidota bacterium]MBU1114759.1 tetratricopeptide repeat protein [Bacteroidota bacterium]MBU1797782.1 tetratricopeptide repeat protein [Bacteroidota bacterium]